MNLEIHDGSRWGRFDGDTPTICEINENGTCRPILTVNAFGDVAEAEKFAKAMLHRANCFEPMLAFIKKVVEASKGYASWMKISHSTLHDGEKLIAEVEKP